MKKTIILFYLFSLTLAAQQTGTEKIIFASFRDSTSYDPSLYYMDIDGSNITRINDTIIGHSPRISHDGKRIAYAGWDPLRSATNTNIHVLDLEANEDKIVSLFKQSDGSYLISGNECISPTWSPDDSLIVYTDFGHWSSAVTFKVKSDTTSGFERTLLSNHLYGEWAFDWLFTENKILFKTKYFNDSLHSRSELFTMHPDGNEKMQLTNYQILYFSAKYSPEENFIAFISEDSDDSLGIYTMKSDGTNLQKIINIGELGHYTSPSLSWSSDEKKIVFSTKEQIYIVDVETKEITQITDDNYWNYTPEWVVFYPTSVDEPQANVVEEFELFQNYPNPFNPSTKIRYEIGEVRFVSLKIYNTLGQEVAVLVDKEQKFGSYEVSFDGSSLSSGIYFYKLSVNGNIKTKSMILLR